MTIYAEKGETVTCENGHEIFDFAETVECGEIVRVESTTNWRQTSAPHVGDAILIKCKACGAPYASQGGNFHFYNGWRSRSFSCD